MARYLLVDDNVAFADNLAEIIYDSGNEAVVADSGARALELAAVTRFDAVVSDMRMPGMNGAELLIRLRRLDPGLPAIIVSAQTCNEDLVRVQHSGLLALLPKPVPIERLLALLACARRDGLVVLVDDNEDFLEGLSEALQLDGFSLVKARTVVEAESLGDVQPFAALVDLRVAGGVDGDAMRCVAAQFPKLPLIGMTAHVGVAPPLQVAAFFIKPFDVGDVIARLEAFHTKVRAAHADSA
jgi:two-component system, response regulator PdtaR